MTNKINIVFFGSTTDSVIVLDALQQCNNVTASRWDIVTVVTQPPRPVGRKQTVTPTPVETWAKEHNITNLSFPAQPDHLNLYADEQTVIDTLQPLKADLLISASYGQKIPTKTIADAAYGGLNVHPSILPRWRGADPVPWAILSGDHQIGVTIVTITEQFDEGKIIAQKKIPITTNDMSDPLRTKLFGVGADVLIDILPKYLDGTLAGTVQNKAGTPYARRFTREDGFEPWEAILKAQTDHEEAVRIDHKFRALMPWPGLWSQIQVTRDKQQGKKRLKILACHLSPVSCLVIDSVQLEGKNPVPFPQFQSAYL